MEDSAVRMMVEGGEMMLRTAGKSARAVALMKSLVEKAWTRHRLKAEEFRSMYPTSVTELDAGLACSFMKIASESGLPHAAVRTEGRKGVEIYFRRDDAERAREILGSIGARDAEIKRIYARKGSADIGLHPSDIGGGRIEAFVIPGEKWEDFCSAAREEGLVFSSEKRKGGHCVCTFVIQDSVLVKVLRRAGIAPLSLVRSIVGETGKYRESVSSRLARISAKEAKKKQVPVLLRDAAPEK